MGDLKDEEVALLSEEIGPAAEEVVALPSQHVSRKTSTWPAAMTLLILIGLLAVIFTIVHTEDYSHEMDNMERREARKARRDALHAPLNVLVVGDWGREGQYNQTLVANQMGNVGRDMELRFIISTGDNFYDSGLDTVQDEKFEESFSDIYTAPSLRKKWYAGNDEFTVGGRTRRFVSNLVTKMRVVGLSVIAVLGNHDYRGNPEVQVDKGLNTRDSRWVCDYTYTLSVDLGHALDGGRKYSRSSSVEFFFIDTNPFEEDYWTDDNQHYKWTRPIPRDLVIANQLKNLTESLETSKATWKIVVGHHTMFSYGSHGNTPELIEKVLPILEANKVDLYVNGHDHTLQHIKRADSDIHFVTSGAGSKAWKGEVPPSNAKDSKLFYDGQGFISISVAPSILQLNYYDIYGDILHQIELTK